jgi:uncharacterized protein
MLTQEQIAGLCSKSASKMAAMRAAIRECGSVLVAFSGGVDSTLVLKVAAQELGRKAVALTALSPSLPPEEERESKDLAAAIGVEQIAVRSDELSNPNYAKNRTDRCYFCKTELYEICTRTRGELGLAVVLDGFNVDDFRDHRPGRAAAREQAVYSPLADAGLGKDEIRAWSSQLGLPTWDKPQMACLASRIPYGTEVTQDRLVQIGAAESALRQLGLKSFRVRYHGPVARIEVATEEYPKFASAPFRQAANQALKAAGFSYIALDLEPFRSGRMNEASSKPGAEGAAPVAAVESPGGGR